jgi:hypothetical protein
MRPSIPRLFFVFALLLPAVLHADCASLRSCQTNCDNLVGIASMGGMFNADNAKQSQKVQKNAQKAQKDCWNDCASQHSCSAGGGKRKDSGLDTYLDAEVNKQKQEDRVEARQDRREERQKEKAREERREDIRQLKKEHKQYMQGLPQSSSDYTSGVGEGGNVSADGKVYVQNHYACIQVRVVNPDKYDDPLLWHEVRNTCTGDALSVHWSDRGEQRANMASTMASGAVEKTWVSRKYGPMQILAACPDYIDGKDVHLDYDTNRCYFRP